MLKVGPPTSRPNREPLRTVGLRFDLIHTRVLVHGGRNSVGQKMVEECDHPVTVGDWCVSMF